MKQYKVSLPDDLYARLEAARVKSGRSLSDEIRTRVERSLELDAGDKSTRDFVEGVMLMPAEIEKETGVAWHKHAGAWAAFRQAIVSRLQRFKPGGTTAFGKRPHQAIPGPDDPEAIGLWAEYHLWDDPSWTNSPRRSAMEQSYRELLEIHRKREGKKS
jgi:hypothetical protein